MGSASEVVVTLTVVGKKVVIPPDDEWVQLYWVKGPDTVRWSFAQAPAAAVRAEVVFPQELPPKYRRIDGFIPGGPFSGTHEEPPSHGSHLKDIVTSGNAKKKGFFVYDVLVYGGDGEVIARADPGGSNDDGPPSSPVP